MEPQHRVMIVINDTPFDAAEKGLQQVMEDVPPITMGTHHLISQAVHGLKDRSGLQVGICSLDPGHRGLAGYVGGADVHWLDYQAGSDEAAGVLAEQAQAHEALLVDASVGHFAEAMNIGKFVKKVYEQVKLVGAAPMVVMPYPVGQDSGWASFAANLFKHPGPTIKVHHYGSLRGNLTTFSDSSHRAFPAPAAVLAYDPQRRMPLEVALERLPLSDDPLAYMDGPAVKAWLREAASSYLLRWFFGRIVDYPARS